MHSCVPQDSVIGPLLFLISVNDLPDVLEALTLFFANDASTGLHSLLIPPISNVYPHFSFSKSGIAFH